MNNPESANLTREDAGYRVSAGARTRVHARQIAGLQPARARSRS